MNPSHDGTNTTQPTTICDGSGGPVSDVYAGHPTITVSSALFAAAHLGHGPDWIPLFLLAVGLGYVYQRTHRLVPGIIAHMLFNSLALVQLSLSLG